MKCLMDQVPQTINFKSMNQQFPRFGDKTIKRVSFVGKGPYWVGLGGGEGPRYGRGCGLGALWVSVRLNPCIWRQNYKESEF